MVSIPQTRRDAVDLAEALQHRYLCWRTRLFRPEYIDEARPDFDLGRGSTSSASCLIRRSVSADSPGRIATDAYSTHAAPASYRHRDDTIPAGRLHIADRRNCVGQETHAIKRSANRPGCDRHARGHMIRRDRLGIGHVETRHGLAQLFAELPSRLGRELG